jgi:hypothetical protein
MIFALYGLTVIAWAWRASIKEHRDPVVGAAVTLCAVTSMVSALSELRPFIYFEF